MTLNDIIPKMVKKMQLHSFTEQALRILPSLFRQITIPKRCDLLEHSAIQSQRL